jgi:hypothetical protein
MRTWIFPVLGLIFLAGCDGSTTSSNNGGGGAGGSGGDTSTTSADGGGGSGTTSDTGSSTSDTGSSSTSDTGSTTAATGCENAGADPVSFVADVQPIFLQSCGSTTTCHLKASPSEGMSLKEGQAYANLVDVPANQACNGQDRVEPGSAAGSYIVNKITGTGVCPGEKKMPPQGDLSDANKQKIIDWICQGAKDN